MKKNYVQPEAAISDLLLEKSFLIETSITSQYGDEMDYSSYF